MKVIEVVNAQHIKEFLAIHRRIYKGDPHFISHIDQDIEKVFDKGKNKYFRHGEVIRWILQNDQGKTIGRVAAFINKKVSDTYKHHGRKVKTGGMGFFECIDDQSAANLLFDTCKNWLMERGMEAMEGPINFGDKDKYWGLTISNFEAPAYYQQNYNPEYYVKFFTDYGFQTYYEQLIYYRDLTVPLQDKFILRAQRLATNPRYKFSIADKKNLQKLAEDFRTIYNRAWANSHSNFAEMSMAQAKLAVKAMKPVMDEELMYFAYYDDKPVGFFIAIPNVNEIFRYVNGNLNWLGKLKFLWYKWRGVSTTCIGVVFGVDPDFQGKGIEGGLFDLVRQYVYEPKKYRHLYIAWIGDFNPKMITIVEDLGTKVFRKMATCMKIFDDSIPFERRKINKTSAAERASSEEAKSSDK